MLLELTELRQTIIEGRTTEALNLIQELDGMSRKAMIRAIRSYLIRLLAHLIKQHAEKRLTNSWAASIRGSIREIQDLNLQDNKKSHYIKSDEWPDYIAEVWDDALDEASQEAFEGRYSATELAAMIDENSVQTIALNLIALIYTTPRKDLSAKINTQLM